MAPATARGKCTRLRPHASPSTIAAVARLMLGPLYHLIDRADRSRAWSEARRVVRPRGVVIAVGISRFASLLDGLKRHELADPAFAEMVRQDLRTGEHRNPEVTQRPGWFTTANFHRPDELSREAHDADLTDVRLFAVEGPAWRVEDIDELDAQLASARAVETEMSLMSATSHVLVVGQRTAA